MWWGSSPLIRRSIVSVIICTMLPLEMNVLPAPFILGAQLWRGSRGGKSLHYERVVSPHSSCRFSLGDSIPPQAIVCYRRSPVARWCLDTYNHRHRGRFATPNLVMFLASKLVSFNCGEVLRLAPPLIGNRVARDLLKVATTFIGIVGLSVAVLVLAVLLARLSTCETMGSTTTICSDNTGSLTLNEVSF
ncbi:hypothetical protein J5N97_030058 [Dioscorea zingiberensis]|uniref:Uncharacterized protein n=1 Tax=Dioscorea zingiberensis TaxID=325984 RepID=A0A9D5BX35_9LILI|nr:hypothetical protein J5N97_030058 [Dioscorea zingiberensis]